MLVEDARRRKEEAEAGGDARSGVTAGSGTAPEKAMHELSATELYQAHAVNGMIRAERELTAKLTGLQDGNKEMAAKIEAQRAEMKRLVEILEGLVADVEGAAGYVEGDELREEIQRGVGFPMGVDEDTKMGG